MLTGSSQLDALRTRRATIGSAADYSSVPDVYTALSGVEGVITTLTDAALKLQVSIAEAAKAAGVQLFVPSEFGLPSDNAPEGLHAVKVEVNKKIRALGLSTALFFTGTFADWCWKPYISLDVKNGSVGVGGDGNAKMSFTSGVDIGRYLTYVLTTLPTAQTKNRTFRIECERAVSYVRFPALGLADALCSRSTRSSQRMSESMASSFKSSTRPLRSSRRT